MGALSGWQHSNLGIVSRNHSPAMVIAGRQGRRTSIEEPKIVCAKGCLIALHSEEDYLNKRIIPVSLRDHIIPSRYLVKYF